MNAKEAALGRPLPPTTTFTSQRTSGGNSGASPNLRLRGHQTEALAAIHGRAKEESPRKLRRRLSARHQTAVHQSRLPLWPL